MNPDGWVILGAKLDSKQLEKDLQKETTKLSKYEKEHDVLIKAKVKIEKSKAMQEYNQLKKAIEDSYSFKLNDPSNTPELTQKYITRQNEEIQKLNEAYSGQLDKIKEINSQLKANATHQVLIKDNIEKINTNLDKAKKLGSIKDNLTGISSETSNILTKVAKWGLAIFSVRSAYMFVRQAVSTISQYNERIGADIQYIRFALASALQPVIETIIQLVYKLLAYINYIAKAWFGVNLFANATVKAFKKVNKGVKDTNKSAKALSKTLLGFDEMNILQKDGTTSTGGGGGGIASPSTDLSKMLGDVEIPDWIEWIADNGELLKDIIIGIGLAFATWKITQLAFGLSGIGTTLPAIFGALQGMSGLQIFGIIAGVATAVVGIYETIKGLIKWISHPTWENFKDVLSGLETVLIGVGVAMVAINASNPIGWITLAIGAIPKLIGFFQDLGNEEEEHIKQTKTIKEAEEDLAKTRNALKSATQNYKNASKEAKQAEKELAEAEKKHKISGKDLYNQVLNGQLTYDKMSKSQKAVYEAYLNNLEAQGNLKTATEKMTQATRDETKAQEDLSVSTYKYKGQYSDYVKTIIDGYEKQKIGAKDMAEKIMYVMSEMDKDTRQKFAENLPQNIKDGFNKAQEEAGYGIRVFSNGVEIAFQDVAHAGESMAKQVGNAGKTAADTLSKQFGTTVPNNIQKSIDKVKTLTSKLGELGKSGAVTISTAIKSATGKGMKTGGILKLASGAVVNNPGHGVPLRSNVYGGEAGREGIIPLTDQQAMTQLGYEIGRNVVVAPTIPVYVGNRLVAKEVRRMDAEDKFAFNG